MPLEIRELVIKTTVNREQSPWATPLNGSSPGTLSQADHSALVATCVEQILAILRSQAER